MLFAIGLDFCKKVVECRIIFPHAGKFHPWRFAIRGFIMEADDLTFSKPPVQLGPDFFQSFRFGLAFGDQIRQAQYAGDISLFGIRLNQHI